MFLNDYIKKYVVPGPANVPVNDIIIPELCCHRFCFKLISLMHTVTAVTSHDIGYDIIRS
jgi:hypothetical protein